MYVSVIVEPLLKGQKVEIYLREVINNVLAKGLALVSRCRINEF